MEPSRELIEQLYREAVREAREMSADEKLAAGAELFDYACEITLAGIRSQHPQADDEECERILEARLALGRRLEAGS